MRRASWSTVLLVAILVVALALRLKEPLSSPIVGAEDPYLHMSKTWDLVQGQGWDHGYPPGFQVLLAPFALMGPEAFYLAARFLPPVLGVVQTLGLYLLARTRLDEGGALAAGLVGAVMPENVFRTDLLFPTALDLAVLPFLLLLVIRASEGSRGAVVGSVLVLLGLLAVHPWVVALLVPVLALFLGVLLLQGRRHLWPLAAAAGAGLVGLVAVFSLVPGTWNPAPQLWRHALPRLGELIADPASLFPLPVYVDLPAMLTAPALVLAAAGVVIALVQRSPLALLALLWSAFLLPLTLVDWLGVWFIPHRCVAYLSLGVALLAGFAVHSILTAAPRRWHAPAASAALAVLLALTLPSAAATQTWYRLYDEDDYDAWEALDGRGAPMVVAGSWQGAEGYRAITGRDAVYDHTFFEREDTRQAWLRDHPGLVVLVDKHAVDNGHPRGFLDGWQPVGTRGDVRAFTKG